MKVKSYPLPPTDRFGHRQVKVQHVPANTGTFFILTVLERRNPQSKEYVRRYLLTDLGMNKEMLGRQFRVKKSMDADKKTESETYNVLLSAFGPKQHRCECKGYERDGTCVHIDTLAMLVRDGGLTLPNADEREQEKQERLQRKTT